MLKSGARQRWSVWIGLTVEASQSLLDLLIALEDEVLVMAPRAQGLSHNEDVFRTPITLKTASDQVAGSFDAIVFERCQFLRVTFARHNGVENGQAADTGEVADDVVDLKVHLREWRQCRCLRHADAKWAVEYWI